MGNRKEQGSLPNPEQSYGELGRYQRLFNAVLPKPEGPIPAEKTQEVIDATAIIIEELTLEEKVVIEKRYLQEKAISIKQVRRESDLSRERIRRVEAEALKKLSQPTKLGRYRPLAESSIARDYLGAVFVGDIDLDFIIDQERLPKEDQDVLREAMRESSAPDFATYFKGWPSRRIITEPLEKEGSLAAKISEKGKMIIAEQLMGYIKHEASAEEKEIFLLTGNRLLSIDIPRETLYQLAPLRLGETGVMPPPRILKLLIFARKETLGEILLLTPYDLTKIKGFGPKRARELGNFFQEILDPDGEKYEPGFLGEDLEKAYLAAQEEAKTKKKDEESPPR